MTKGPGSSIKLHGHLFGFHAGHTNQSEALAIKKRSRKGEKSERRKRKTESTERRLDLEVTVFRVFACNLE